MERTTYAIALGSNRRGIHGAPAATIRAALAAVGGVVAVSPIIASAPLGPSIRRYANAVALIETRDSPPVLLARLKRDRDRVRAAARAPLGIAGDRSRHHPVVGGAWRGPGLNVPHAAYRDRGFVLAPLARIAPRWRDPLTGQSVRHLAHKVDRPRLRP
ncbi:2-amino-4-hydroxy-6-hydroxymethyldihydropteridine diphosphokinase [Sphingomonas aerolata]